MTSSEPTRASARGWSTIGGLGVDDLVVATLLSAAMVGLVTGHIASPGRHGGIGAAIAGLTMTVPVAWRRRAPLSTAAALLVGALINTLGVGPMVRCGPGLPALLLAGYALGRRHADWRTGLGACGFLMGSAFLQVHYDPDIRSGGLPMSFVLSLIIAGFWGAGTMLRSRAALVEALAARTADLRRQRDDNARIAVAADRGRIADDVDRTLDQQLSDVVRQARRAQALLVDEPDEAQQVFVGIQRTARGTLTQLRRSVRTVLADDVPHQPAPVLAELTALVEHGHQAETRLTIDGEPRALPAGLELSAYRIVERLLQVLAATPDTEVSVRVNFAPDVLEQRAVLHGGTVAAGWRDADWSAQTRLPLVAAAD
jgi:signal transduction histidine kinase